MFERQALKYMYTIQKGFFLSEASENMHLIQPCNVGVLDKRNSFPSKHGHGKKYMLGIYILIQPYVYKAYLGLFKVSRGKGVLKR